MKTISLFNLAIILCFLGCTPTIPSAEKVAIIPAPNHLKIESKEFVIDENTVFVIPPSWQQVGNYLQHFVEKGLQLPLRQLKNAQTNFIQFHLDSQIKNKEAYRLSIATNSIHIHAGSEAGAFYAVQTLMQLFPTHFESPEFNKKQIAIQCLSIEDAPAYAYRGMHLDVGRHFYSVEFIKKYIDMLSRLKLNRFHWHLTEDQGWRIEIKKYPKLTSVGAFRKETLIGHARNKPHQFDGKPYGGFYTQDQIKEIVAYAKQRFVTVIPEIELPGHSSAAIAAYPELGCGIRPVEVATKWGIFDDIYCPKESTFAFLEDVLDEVMMLFPSEYIHIGGDEAPKANWNACSNCQKRIQQLGLKDSHELQSYFIKRIEMYLNRKGRQIIGWDEILEGGLAPNATVMSWRGVKGAIATAQQGNPVILTPNSHCYFDYYQAEGDQPLAIGGYLPLEKVYSFNPQLEALTAEERKHIMGIQGNVWTEYMPTSQQVEYMAFPRIMALSELAWTSQKDHYGAFASRAMHYSKRLKTLNVNVAPHYFNLQPKYQMNHGKLHVTFDPTKYNLPIHYHTGGNAFSLQQSKAYTQAIPIDKTTSLFASICTTDGKPIGKPFQTKIYPHIGISGPLTINPAPSKKYDSGGTMAIQNGVLGSKRYGDNEWLGFATNAKETIWLEYQWDRNKSIKSLRTRFHNAKAHWIYAPTQIKLYTNKKDKAIASYTIAPNTEQIIEVLWSFEEIQTKHLYIEVIPFGTIPAAKQGAGHLAWTFLDEMILE
ncbi:MAG: beta-N-acetylhexosaminidase [Flavobacteriaceae bacterium]|nr:beta-N-acetylhexosaminidase [Flavobacteriaceae bacterium]